MGRKEQGCPVNIIVDVAPMRREGRESADYGPILVQLIVLRKRGNPQRQNVQGGERSPLAKHKKELSRQQRKTNRLKGEARVKSQ